MTTTENTTGNTEIRPFTVTIPEEALADLRTRLEQTRYAAPAPGDSWDYGTPVSYLQDMVERWKTFDWRAQEARINAVPNFVTEVDGQTIHFVHVRSAREDATPLLLLHTYPGSFVEFLDVVAAADRRLPPRDPLDARLRLQHPGRRRRLDHGPGRPDLRRPDAPARLLVVRRPRQRRRRDDRSRARGAEPGGLPGGARAAAVLVPVRRPERVRGLRSEGVRRAGVHGLVPVGRRLQLDERHPARRRSRPRCPTPRSASWPTTSCSRTSATAPAWSRPSRCSPRSRSTG